MPYNNDSYELLYTQLFEDTAEEQFENLRNREIAAYRTKTIKSGPILECEIFPLWKTSQAAKRAAKAAKSRMAQINLNDRNARKTLTRKINANFTRKDIWFTGTFEDAQLPKTMEDAQRLVKNYIERLKYRRKKLGLPSLRYVYVIEHREESKKEGKAVRYHVHIVMSGDLDRDLVESLWTYGARREAHRLQPDEFGLEGLARYMTKTKAGQRRWGASTGLKKPKITTADHKIKRRHAEKLARNETDAREYFQKLYPGYVFTSMEVLKSEHVSGTYIYTKMRLLEAQP